MGETYLEGQVALVTGSAKGIGKAISSALAARGASIAVVDVEKEEGRSAASELVEGGGRALFIDCDLRNEKEILNAVDRVIQEFGRIDILVNNAGICAIAAVWELPTETFDHIITVNLRGTFLFCKYVVPHMIRRKSGKIINIASGVGRQSQPLMSGYGISKAGQISLTVSLAKEVGEFGINVNAVCPGPVDTALWTPMKAPLTRVLNLPESEVVNWFTQNKQVIKKALKPEDIADAVCWLVSPQAKMLTGQAISVDGGEIVPTY
ncbi:MAG: SDR family NAD(P)-dependent oxidoreductase [Thermodesulfobacteriota bacterium]